MNALICPFCEKPLRVDKKQSVCDTKECPRGTQPLTLEEAIAALTEVKCWNCTVELPKRAALNVGRDYFCAECVFDNYKHIRALAENPKPIAVEEIK